LVKREEKEKSLHGLVKENTPKEKGKNPLEEKYKRSSPNLIYIDIYIYIYLYIKNIPENLNLIELNHPKYTSKEVGGF